MENKKNVCLLNYNRLIEVSSMFEREFISWKKKAANVSKSDLENLTNWQLSDEVISSEMKGSRERLVRAWKAGVQRNVRCNA